MSNKSRQQPIPLHQAATQQQPQAHAAVVAAPNPGQLWTDSADMPAVFISQFQVAIGPVFTRLAGYEAILEDVMPVRCILMMPTESLISFAAGILNMAAQQNAAKAQQDNQAAKLDGVSAGV